MYVTLLLTIAIAAICYAIYLKQELSTSKTIADNLTSDNRLKANAIERHLKEKVELQANYSKEEVDLRSKVKDYTEQIELRKKEYDIREKAWEQTKKSFLDKVAELKELREIITRKDETIARYKAEIDKLNNPSKKKPYHFDESKAPKTPKTKTK